MSRVSGPLSVSMASAVLMRSRMLRASSASRIESSFEVVTTSRWPRVNAARQRVRQAGYAGFDRIVERGNTAGGDLSKGSTESYVVGNRGMDCPFEVALHIRRSDQYRYLSGAIGEP